MRYRKHTIFAALAIVLFCSLASQAQDKAQPDFSGTWLFEKSTSLYSSKLYNEKETEVSGIFDQWVITRSGLEIAVRQSFRYDLIHHKTRERVKALAMDRKWTVFTDGRGDRYDTGDAESVTNWDKTKLVTVFYSKPDKKGKKSKIGTLQMELADDGKTLVVSLKDFKEAGEYIPGFENYMLLNPFPFNRRDYYKLRQD